MYVPLRMPAPALPRGKWGTNLQNRWHCLLQSTRRVVPRRSSNSPVTLLTAYSRRERLASPLGPRGTRRRAHPNRCHPGPHTQHQEGLHRHPALSPLEAQGTRQNVQILSSGSPQRTGGRQSRVVASSASWGTIHRPVLIVNNRKLVSRG